MPQSAQSPDRKEYLRQWHLENRERRLQDNRARYRANPQKAIALSNQYRKLHPEKARAWYKKYRETNAELCRRRNRDWYKRNAESERAKTRADSKAAYAVRRDEILARNRAWAGRNKDKIRLRDLRRKALIAEAKVNLEGMEQWIRTVRSRRTFVCYYCQQRKPISVLHIDHIVALASGGEHSVKNLCTSCASCNCSKQAKSVSAWVRVGQQVLEL